MKTDMDEKHRITYFAYGSNLLFGRIHERVPSVRHEGIGRLCGYRLLWDKCGGGSGKCRVQAVADPTVSVWGRMYEFEAAELGSLDRAEGLGVEYERVQVTIRTETGDDLEAMTYFALRLDPEAKPFDWYKGFVVEGARECGLPAEYVAELEAVESLPDPDEVQQAENDARLRRFVRRP